MSVTEHTRSDSRREHANLEFNPSVLQCEFLGINTGANRSGYFVVIYKMTPLGLFLDQLPNRVSQHSKL